MSNATQTYREVQRKANAGERIKIVKAEMAFGRYRNGDEFIANEITRLGVDVPEVSAECNRSGFISDREYLVLEPIATPAPLAETAALSLPDLFAQFIRDNAPAVRSYLAEIEPVDSAEPLADVFEIKTPLTRAKVIEMARERVAELERIGRDDDAFLTEDVEFRGKWFEIKFAVNRDKRTVTALVYELDGLNGTYARYRRKPDAVGIAKAAPDDVFNADIGKAIAAERALGLALTDAFVNAPKPTPASGAKVRKITGRNIGRVFTLKRRRPDCDGMGYGGNAFNTDFGGWTGDKQYVVIDDTDAVYTQEGAKDGEAA